MVPGALHYGQVANEHQIKLALNQCHQEDKKKDLCTQNMTNDGRPQPTMHITLINGSPWQF
jgi:hypothetical protein